MSKHVNGHLQGHIGGVFRPRLLPSGTAAETRPTVTMLYDERFTIDRAATIASNTPFAASHAGNTKLYNHGTGFILNGVYNINGAASVMVIDAAAARARLQGRVHYCKHAIGTTSDFQTFLPISLVGESPAANWWAVQEGQPGIVFKGGAAGFGDVRNVTGTSQGNYQKKSAVQQNGTYEWAIVERTTGSMSLMRVNAGDWRVIWFEKSLTLAAKMHARNDASGVTTIDHMCTANTSWYPAPLVQHSFATATTPSDGLGQPETEGGGVVGTSVGDVTISGSALQMSTDTEGFVHFDTGQTSVSVGADLTVYDGSRVGVVFRVVDSANYMAAIVNSSNNTLRIVEVVAGVETTLVSQDSNLTPDFYDLPDASSIYLTVHVDGNNIRASYAPGALHLTYVETTSSRFSTATNVGCLVSKGAGVNSSKATNLVAFKHVQDVPVMEEYP